jgi:glycogen debranching enzyme
LVERLENPAAGGFLWVRRANPNGIANQVWQDSYDAYFFADGTLLNPELPFAPVAVQGYAFDALLVGAELLCQSPGEAGFSPEWLRTRARRLRAQVLHQFWQADLRTFAAALAFDASGQSRPARVVGSEPGHLLVSRLLDGDDVAPLREVLIERLFEDDLLGSAGIRTKSTTSARFNPGSYHNGSIWPMDNGVIADGLRRHNAQAAATELEDRILAACRATGGFPEFVRGDVGKSIVVNNVVVDTLADGQMRRLEQPPQLNQGWTATRVWRILRHRNWLSLD